MKISIKLMTSEPLAERGYPVKVVARDKKLTPRRKVLFHAFPSDWDFESEQPLKTHPDYNRIYPDFLTVKNRIYDAEKCKTFESAFEVLFRDMGMKESNRVNGKSFFRFAEVLVKEMRMQRRDGNANIYENAVSQFGNFKNDLNFDEFSTEFVLAYKNFLLTKNINAGKLNKDGSKKPEAYLKKNTVHQYIRTLQAIYNDAVLRGVAEDKTAFKGVYKNITVKVSRTKKKHLSIETLKSIENHELVGRPGRSLDLFLLMFYLGGQNLKDLYYLKSENVVNDRVYFQRGKLAEGGFEFDVKLYPKARAILGKYGNLDSDYVFDWPKDYNAFKNFYRNLMTGLSLAQNQMEIFVLPTGGKLGVNVARHTFSTIGVQKQVNREIKALLMGHEIGDVQSVYEDYPEEMRDSEHWKIISLD